MTEEKDEYQKHSDREMTAQEVADHLGVTRQNVADIEKRALRKALKMLQWKLDKQDILPD